jgi:cytochrome P450
MVVKETFRLTSVVQFLQRRPAEDVTILGHVIPKGTAILLTVQNLHTDAKYWKDPQVFNPERFADLTITPGMYIPFGDGPHNCIGQKMAMIEMKILVIEILRKFHVAMAPGKPVQLLTSITHGPKHGLCLDLKLRS